MRYIIIAAVVGVILFFSHEAFAQVAKKAIRVSHPVGMIDANVKTDVYKMVDGDVTCYFAYYPTGHQPTMDCVK